MLFLPRPGIGLSRRRPARSHRPHFRTQTFDEMLDVKRQRRAAFHRNVSVEPCRLDDAQQFDAGITAMGDGKLVDHGNAETLLQEDGSPHTAHTTNPVPVLLTAPEARLQDGELADVAPTILALLGLDGPTAMVGKNLVQIP